MRLFGKTYWARVLEAAGVAFVGAFVPLEAGILAAVSRHDLSTLKTLALSAILAGAAAAAKAALLATVARNHPAAKRPAARRPAAKRPAAKRKTSR